MTRPPTGSVVPNAFKAMWIGARNGFKMDAAKPSYQAAHGQKYDTSKWNDLFIDEVKRGLIGCKVFVIYPIYWVGVLIAISVSDRLLTFNRLCTVRCSTISSPKLVRWRCTAFQTI